MCCFRIMDEHCNVLKHFKILVVSPPEYARNLKPGLGFDNLQPCANAPGERKRPLRLWN